MTPRAVLDTNVIVSGLGWHGPPTTIIDAALDGRLVLVTSPPLLAELRRVLRYPKLAKVIHDAEQLVDLLQDSSLVVMPSRVFALVDDETDNRILEAAVEGNAHYIVSGDRHLLDLDTVEGIPLLTPTSFIDTELTDG